MLVPTERSCHKEYSCEISKLNSKVKVLDRNTEWQTGQKRQGPDGRSLGHKNSSFLIINVEWKHSWTQPVMDPAISQTRGRSRILQSLGLFWCPWTYAYVFVVRVKIKLYKWTFRVVYALCADPGFTFDNKPCTYVHKTARSLLQLKLT